MLDIDQQLILVKDLHKAQTEIIDLKRAIIARAKLQDAVIEKLRQRMQFAFKLARTCMSMENYKTFVAKMDLHDFEQYESKTD